MKVPSAILLATNILKSLTKTLSHYVSVHYGKFPACQLRFNQTYDLADDLHEDNSITMFHKCRQNLQNVHSLMNYYFCCTEQTSFFTSENFYCFDFQGLLCFMLYCFL